MTIFVSSASSRDLEAISSLLRDTWHATYDHIYGVEKVAEITAKWHSPGALAENLARPNSEFVIAGDGSEIAGMAYACMDNDRVLKLHQLYVRPAMQGRGIGAMLLEDITGCFPGAVRIRLEVEEANRQAIAFYKRHGFDNAGATGNCGQPDSGIPALLMEKPLT